METKFTPGPWAATPYGHMEHAVQTPGELTNGGFVVAVCPGPDRGANTRLIAAAPEMYELLEKVDALCKSPTDDHEFACDVEDALDEWRELRARINA